jgi:hypothetical protein
MSIRAIWQAKRLPGVDDMLAMLVAMAAASDSSRAC